MTPTAYTDLKKRLQAIEKAIVKAQVKAARGPSKASVQALHRAAETGGGFDAFAGVIARRSAVQFLLRTLYVRAMEDLQLIDPPFIRGQRTWQAFREVAPSLGMRAYLRWVFRDLAVDYPELFAQRADELPLPPEDLCQQVWDLWHDEDATTGTLRFDWSGEGFDSRFLGDLYQDLDQEVRKRFALLQTPDFVEEYILDHTLTPAIAHFDPAAMRARGERFRIIDPTCGSGHFLTGAFHRLADYWQAQELSAWDAAVAALDGVWGCDINPHAVHIAHVRLLLEVIARTGVRDAARLKDLPIHLRVMDSLVPWEGTPRGHQSEAFADERLGKYGDAAEREGHRAFLDGLFQVVVGNPPYITPKDTQKRSDYRQFWPETATGRYGLSAPFVERFLSLACSEGWTGQITGNAFTKRDFGIPLIEGFLPRFDLTDVVDTSGAYIPGHGTPTVVLFIRMRPPVEPTVRVIAGKRGEPSAPSDPRHGRVWTEIRQAEALDNAEGHFVSVEKRDRLDLSSHPWNLSGGGAQALQSRLEADAPCLGGSVVGLGLRTNTNAGELLDRPLGELARSGVEAAVVSVYVVGDAVRDYSITEPREVPVPYSSEHRLMPLEGLPGLNHFLWPHRNWLAMRWVSGGTRLCDVGLPHHAIPQHPKKPGGELGIVAAFVATHNHFVLDRGGNVFKQSAPIIKLPASASLDDHLDLLGLLNSSTLGFWMRQVFFSKGGDQIGDGGRASAEVWSDRLEYDSTKLKQAPITEADRPARVALARALDATAQRRAACLPAAVLADTAWTAASLAADLAAAVERYHALTHEMVALQEELDWLTYQSYGLLESVDVRTPETIEPLAPGHRPFELRLAKHNATCDPDERSAWFSRHGHDETQTLPDHYSAATRALSDARLALIAKHAEIRLIEQPQFKRRWQLADFEKATHDACRDWLLDRLEDCFAEGGPLAEPEPYRLERVVQVWREDDRVRAVAAVLTGDADVDLSVLAERLLLEEGIPDNIFRVYTDEGLRKLRQWQKIWQLQDREDAGETVKIPPPPEFKADDFVKDAFFKIRGKLNVPRERFIVFDDLLPRRYGWNGWRDTDRALAQLEVFTLAESDPEHPLPRPTTDDPRRCGATVGLWESLPDVKRWGELEHYAELAGEAERGCGQKQCPCDAGQAWREWRAGKRIIVRPQVEVTEEVSVDQRTQVLTLVNRLFQPDLLDPKKSQGPRLLDLEGRWPGSPVELAQILDRLVLLGELATKGRGKNRRFTPISSQ